MEKVPRILVIDDKPSMLNLLCCMLEERYQLTTSGDAEEGLRKALEGDYDVVVTDVKMPMLGGLQILHQIKIHKPQTEVIVMTAYAEVAHAVEAMRAGAYDYITKPFEPDEMVLIVQKAVERRRLLETTRRLQQQVEDRFGFDNLVGTSPPMQKVYALVRDVCASEATVLITGESGTGKELVARAIHYTGPRAKGPFVPINCAAIPRDLLESELFGHVKGAFSGAQSDRRGLVEEAGGGTLFLDEISEMALDLQGKITRMIQEREVRPVGGSRVVRVDVRIIAATHTDLKRAVAEKRFREDLYYRLHVYPVHLPPLRDRRDDIPVLAYHFLKRYAEREGKPIAAITPKAMEALHRYAWPGNVRELENVIERAAILTRDRTIALDSLPDSVRLAQGIPSAEVDLGVPYKKWIQGRNDALSRRYLDALLARFSGNVTRAAEHAGMERETLHRLAKRLEIDPQRYRA